MDGPCCLTFKISLRKWSQVRSTDGPLRRIAHRLNQPGPTLWPGNECSHGPVRECLHVRLRLGLDGLIHPQVMRQQDHFALLVSGASCVTLSCLSGGWFRKGRSETVTMNWSRWRLSGSKREKIMRKDKPQITNHGKSYGCNPSIKPCLQKKRKKGRTKYISWPGWCDPSLPVSSLKSQGELI